MGQKKQHFIKYPDFKLSKARGQNFLIDENVTQKIVRLSGIDKTCAVLEVGPGLGALTKVLADTACHVTAVEIDTRLMVKLRDMFGDTDKVTLIQGDILKTDIIQLLSGTPAQENRHVCANLPYSITTPVIIKLVESAMFKSITVMVQKEVAERICAPPGSGDYGAFSVFAAYYTQPEILFDIPPGCFSPRPKVTSSVVRMSVKPELPLSGDDEVFFFRIVKAAFAQRRKTLVNALYSAFQNTYRKNDIEKAISDCGFDTNIRGEVLGADDFIELSESFRHLTLGL